MRAYPDEEEDVLQPPIRPILGPVLDGRAHGWDLLDDLSLLFSDMVIEREREDERVRNGESRRPSTRQSPPRERRRERERGEFQGEVYVVYLSFIC